jgi:hypothetical protein
MLAIYGGNRRNKIPGQTKTSTAALRLTEGSVEARGRKTSKTNHLVLQVGGYAKGQLHSHVKYFKLKTLIKGLEPDGLADAGESEYKAI